MLNDDGDIIRACGYLAIYTGEEVRVNAILKHCKVVADSRNGMLHSSIYSDRHGQTMIKNKRLGTRAITSREVYQLANEIAEMHSALCSLQFAATRLKLAMGKFANPGRKPIRPARGTARIERLREKLKHGDPDMTGDEIQAAIERTEEKRSELHDFDPAAMPSTKVFRMLPQAAEEYRRQIVLGLDGEPRAAAKARSILRELFGGRIRLVPQSDGGLVAHWNLHTASMLKGLGTIGSGGAISTVPVELPLIPHHQEGPKDTAHPGRAQFT